MTLGDGLGYRMVEERRMYEVDVCINTVLWEGFCFPIFRNALENIQDGGHPPQMQYQQHNRRLTVGKRSGMFVESDDQRSLESSYRFRVT